uniref:disease resistance protein RUN1-like n=1 Tax=Erigeron canadensis TaxID=72917 RepID=UPI001CB908DA|nr:disease resistance protein RUN1-like [Erigeron canadensis]
MVILSEIVEGSATHTYDVFLSFRGADTRNSFTDHLYNALIDAGINTFLDDEEIETGEDLKPELEDAIRSSRASVIVLSENYATSSWCLDELALILDQRRVSDQIVIPIFYHVDPTDVRKQQNSFGDAMGEHRRKKMEAGTNAKKRDRWGQKMDGWKNALTEVANLKGKDVNGRKESDFIQEIVSEILQSLGVHLSDALPLLIGRYHHIGKITSWLTDGSFNHNANVLTVLGMSGIGKTSLAKYVFHLHSRKFDKSSFLEGISLRCTGKFNGLVDVQKQLYDDILKKNKPPVHDSCAYTSKIEKVLSRVKVLLVLDDIDSVHQLDALLGNKGLHPGSKIIITTRDMSLTERCALFKPGFEPTHTKLLIESLYRFEAVELLSMHAFNCKDPKEGYEEVVEKLLKYCEGHPLALEVLGKSLRNRDIAYWEACVDNLKKGTHSGIRKVLQMSYDSLPFPNDKELFKHIACFFVGLDREISEKILMSCDINTTSGIPNLIERCLLSVDQWDNSLKMHQMIQEMGKAIVREESPDHPGKRSRLWCHDESLKVLKRKKGTENLKGLVLDTRMLEKEKPFDLKTDAFRNMDNLMILQLNYVQLSGSYEDFPEELRWLRLHGFPLKFIPSDIPMENLVVLDMSYSKIESFGTYRTDCYPQPLEGGQKLTPLLEQLIGSCSEDKRILGSLKILDVSFCEQLDKLGGFYELPTLERLIARNCIRLIKICESLEECIELVYIDLSYCVKLEKLPTAIGKLKNVETLLLDGCDTSSSIMEEVPSHLNFNVISLLSSLVRLSLANNNLSNESFPMDMSSLSSLKYLCLDENPIVYMPSCVRSLCILEELHMRNCKTLMTIEHPPTTLKRLYSHSDKSMLQRIIFDPDMSPSRTFMGTSRPWSYEIEGMVKVQALESVEEKVLSTLGWTHLFEFDFLKKSHVVTYRRLRGRAKEYQIQMYYEFGIFSTFYGGQGMPDGISWNIRSPPLEVAGDFDISFTVPSSPKKQQLRGLNLCYVQRKEDYGQNSQELFKKYGYPLDGLFYPPVIEIRNKTKGLTWIYKHCIGGFDVGGEWLTYISYWMFGMNEMEAGDEIIITEKKGCQLDQRTENCGVNFVYEDDQGTMENDESMEYYKSWNHIIGGDLSAFETTTGEYVLYHPQISRSSNKYPPIYWGKYACVKYKEATLPFRAFSKRKIPK